MTECQICLDLSDVVKLCGECFGPHYRLMHRIATNPEEEKKLADEQAFEKATGQKLPKMAREAPLHSTKTRPTFLEMHPNVRDWRPGGMAVWKKNDKRRGKSKREADMEIVQAFIREKFTK